MATLDGINISLIISFILISASLSVGVSQLAPSRYHLSVSVSRCVHRLFYRLRFPPGCDVGSDPFLWITYRLEAAQSWARTPLKAESNQLQRTPIPQKRTLEWSWFTVDEWVWCFVRSLKDTSNAGSSTILS